MVKKILSFFIKIFISIFLGVSLALVWFGHDTRYTTLVHTMLQKTFKEQFGATFEGVVKTHSFIPLSLTFKDVLVTPAKEGEEWFWKADLFGFSVSLTPYLYSGVCHLHVKLKNGKGFSGVRDNYPAIVEHIKSMVAGMNMGIPLVLQSIVIDDACFTLEDAASGSKVTTCFKSDTKRTGNEIVTRSVLKDTCLSRDHRSLLTGLSAKVSFTYEPAAGLTGSFKGNGVLPFLPKKDQKIVVRGSYKTGEVVCSCFNMNRTFVFEPVKLFMRDKKWHIETRFLFPLSIVSYVCNTGAAAQSIQGACSGMCKGSMDDLSGSLRIPFAQFQDYKLHDVEITFTCKDRLVQGDARGSYNEQTVEGTWHHDVVEGTGEARAVNKTALFWDVFKYWQVQPYEFQLDAQWHKKDLTLVSKWQAQHTKLKTNLKNRVAVALQGTDFSLTGSCNNYSYQAGGSVDPLCLAHGCCKSPSGKQIVQFTYDCQSCQFKTMVDYESVSSLVAQFTNVTLPGAGSLVYNGTWSYPFLQGKLTFKDGIARVGGWYNFVSDIHADVAFDCQKLLLTGKDTRIVLHKGVLNSSEWAVQAALSSGVTWAHVPLTFSDCFINWKKDLYAVVSGSGVWQKLKNKQPLLKGMVLLDRGHLKANILSSTAQKSMMPVEKTPYNCALDISLYSVENLGISAGQLETKASCGLSITGTPADLHVAGKIVLHGGHLYFPAYPLKIHKGVLKFLPHHLYDPEISLVAQNRIKKYLVTLSVAGTAQDPHIVLEATPPLSEQQILMLLLGGSEEESLKNMIPALLMRNMETILFGAQRATDTPKSRLASWLDPLKRVTFIPQFTDQSGRGGFKGALEIDVSKRLRAVIEKNFSLTEDIAVTVDYLLSKDVSLRATRDPRGDLGAEVEMRFKF